MICRLRIAKAAARNKRGDNVHKNRNVHIVQSRSELYERLCPKRQRYFEYIWWHDAVCRYASDAD